MANKRITELEEIIDITEGYYFPVATVITNEGTYKLNYGHFVKVYAKKDVVDNMQQDLTTLTNEINSLQTELLVLKNSIGGLALITGFSGETSTALPQLFNFDVIEITDYTVYLPDPSILAMQNSGVYNFCLTAKFENPGNDISDINIWMTRNGNPDPIPNSNFKMAIPKTTSGVHGKATAVYNFMTYTASPGIDYFQFYWQCNSRDVKLAAEPNSGPIPDTPSIRLIINRHYTNSI